MIDRAETDRKKLADTMARAKQVITRVVGDMEGFSVEISDSETGMQRAWIKGSAPEGIDPKRAGLVHVEFKRCGGGIYRGARQVAIIVSRDSWGKPMARYPERQKGQGWNAEKIEASIRKYWDMKVESATREKELAEYRAQQGLVEAERHQKYTDLCTELGLDEFGRDVGKTMRLEKDGRGGYKITANLNGAHVTKQAVNALFETGLFEGGES